MKRIPNLFTLLNLVCGCFAIVFALQKGFVLQETTDGMQFLGIPEKIWMASFFIGLAGIIDFLDGFIARMMKAQSIMGIQLDSLADVVSFGVAPSMIIYQFMRFGFAQKQEGMEVSLIWLTLAFLPAAAAAYRLAKFNLDTTQQYGFKGLPTPAAGILTASIPLIYWNSNNPMIPDLLTNLYFLYGYVIVISWLMVSRIPMMSLKIREKTLKGNLSKLLLIGLSLVAIFLLKWIAIPVIFILYIVLSLAFKKQSS